MCIEFVATAENYILYKREWVFDLQMIAAIDIGNQLTYPATPNSFDGF